MQDPQRRAPTPPGVKAWTALLIVAVAAVLVGLIVFNVFIVAAGLGLALLCGLVLAGYKVAARRRGRVRA